MQMRGNFATPVWPTGLSGLTTDEDRQKVGGNFPVHQTQVGMGEKASSTIQPASQIMPMSSHPVNSPTPPAHETCSLV